MLQVTGVSERGLRIDSPVPLPENYEFCFASNIFHNLGITTPQLRVVSCEPSSLSEGLFTLKLEYCRLAEPELHSIRQWLNVNKPPKKTA